MLLCYFSFFATLCFSLYFVLTLLVRGKHWKILLQMIENFSKAFIEHNIFSQDISKNILQGGQKHAVMTFPVYHIISFFKM